jgi:predicted nucleic acid-binding protein
MGKKKKLISLSPQVATISLDFQSAKAAGIIYGTRKKTGKIIDVEDAMLAGEN